jgi:ABC-type antimicrobial peptide transport system permease subunit
MRLVAVEGFQLVALGLLSGFVASAALTRLMVFMLYGVSPLDASTWTLSGAIMAFAALLAVLIPAARAARADPLVAIQAE